MKHFIFSFSSYTTQIRTEKPQNTLSKMKRSVSQSEHEFRSGLGQVGNRAGATNLTVNAQGCSQSNNLHRTSSLTTLRPGERYRDRFRAPSEGNIPLSRDTGVLSSARVGREASLDISHDSGVWVRDSSAVGEKFVKVNLVIWLIFNKIGP